jgi:hypothetical protein
MTAGRTATTTGSDEATEIAFWLAPEIAMLAERPRLALAIRA